MIYDGDSGKRMIVMRTVTGGEDDGDDERVVDVRRKERVDDGGWRDESEVYLDRLVLL